MSGKSVYLVRKFLLIMLILTQSSCWREGASGDRAIVAHRRAAFESFKKAVSAEVFKNFPLSEDEIATSKVNSILFPDAMPSSGYAGVFTTYDSLPESVFLERAVHLRAAAVHESGFRDSCNNYVAATIPGQNCPDELIPLPSVNSSYNHLADYPWSESTYFLVFDFKFGTFLHQPIPETFIHEEWKHGFSNGAVVDPVRRSISYWVIIW